MTRRKADGVKGRGGRPPIDLKGSGKRKRKADSVAAVKAADKAKSDSV